MSIYTHSENIFPPLSVVVGFLSFTLRLDFTPPLQMPPPCTVVSTGYTPSGTHGGWWSKHRGLALLASHFKSHFQPSDSAILFSPFSCISGRSSLGPCPFGGVECQHPKTWSPLYSLALLLPAPSLFPAFSALLKHTSTVTSPSCLRSCSGSFWNWLCLAQGSLVLCSWRTPLQHPPLPAPGQCHQDNLHVNLPLCIAWRVYTLAGALWQYGQGSEHSPSQSHTQFAARAQQSINTPQSITWITWGRILIFQSMALILTSKIK